MHMCDVISKTQEHIGMRSLNSFILINFVYVCVCAYVEL